jgi:membrane associated rhomboid family serine protease
MRSNGPVMLALPAFRGVTRRLILIAGCSFLFFFILGFVSPGLADSLTGLLVLHADLSLRLPWQFATWPFIFDSILGFLFALLSLWYFGSALEDERGPRWLGELFFFAAIGGGLLACVISLSAGRYFTLISASGKSSNGLWPIVLALMLVYARFHPNDPLSFNFIFRARAKYIAAGFLLVYLLIDIYINKRFDALNTVCDALFAWFFVKIAPRRGLRHAVSESLFSMRNNYYRSKRRRAAKKFQVYMRKQGKDVSIDDSGRYMGLDDDDPNDKRRMN